MNVYYLHAPDRVTPLKDTLEGVNELYKAGKIQEAQKLQAIVARGDWAAIRGGIIGTKAGLVAHFGYGGFARRPLPRPSQDEEDKWKNDFDELVKTEKSL